MKLPASLARKKCPAYQFLRACPAQTVDPPFPQATMDSTTTKMTEAVHAKLR